MLWEISRQVRSRRGELGLSQFQLSISAGVRRQTVAELESGTVWPDAATLARVCSVLRLELGVSGSE
jgi:transcriptional regulator with XRE-family HTH domain